MRIPSRALHGLLIGIDDYGSAEGSDPSPAYPALAGCVRDAQRMRRFLTRQEVLPVAHLDTLISPCGRPGTDTSPATYEGIVKAFAALRARAKPGDAVWIHFSGHGGRTPTRYPELKGSGAFDEALVPADIGWRDSRYLCDLELGLLLEGLVRAGLFVTLVLDCCHAGGLLRLEGEAPNLPGARARWNQVSDWVRLRPSAVAPEEDLVSSWRRRHQSLATGSSTLVSPVGYVALFACRPFERAYEYDVEAGKPGGALTHFLLKSLCAGRQGTSFDTIFEGLRSAMRAHLGSYQNPQVEGASARVLLSGEQGSASRGATVLLTQGDRVLIAAGAAHGVGPGARFEIEPLLPSAARSPVLAQAVDVSGVECWARLSEDASESTQVPEAGDRAILCTLAPRPATVVVNLGHLTAREVALWQPLAERVKALDSPWLAAQSARRADLELRPQSGGEILVMEARGSFAGTIPRAIASGLAGTENLLSLVEHLLHYRALATLENGDCDCPLKDAIVGDFLRLPMGFKPGLDPCEAGESLGKPATVEADAWITLRLENRFDQPLEVAVLELTPTWSVTQVHPTAADSHCLDPGELLTIPFQAALEPELAASRSHLRIFATYDPVRFCWLELPSLGLSRQRTVRPRPVRHPLESQLAAWGGMGPAKMVKLRDRFASREWAVFDLVLEIRSTESAGPR